MTTTLLQQYERARDPDLRRMVEAAMDEILPDIVGETVGTTWPAHPAGGPDVTLTQAMIDKRHTWAQSILGSSTTRAHWINVMTALLCGEQTIRNVDLPSLPTESQVRMTVKRLVNDCSGIKAGD